MMVTPSDYVIAYGVLFFCICMVALICIAAGKAVYSIVKAFNKGRMRYERNRI